MDILNLLPHEDIIFPRILSFLTIAQLFSLRLVSKLHYQLVQEFFRINTKLDLTKVSTKVTPDAFKLMTDGNSNLRVLHLPNTNHWLTDDLLIPVLSKCHMLVSIDVSNCTQLSSKSVSCLGLNCSQLTSLSFKGCHWLDKDNFNILISNNHQIKSINLSSCWSLNDENIIYLSECCKHLTYLNIDKIYGITNQSLEHISRNCQNLKCLSVIGCWRIDNFAIRMVGEYCKNLSELNVADCRSITEASLARLRVKGVRIDEPMLVEETLRRLEYTFEYARPYIRLQT